jgi:hypothetical protein
MTTRTADLSKPLTQERLSSLDPYLAPVVYNLSFATVKTSNKGSLSFCLSVIGKVGLP